MNYLRKALGPVPQSEPARSDQVANHGGGYAFKIDPWTRLARFLVLGTEGSTFYQSEHELTAENLDGVRACIAENGIGVVQLASRISIDGRAPKNDPALLVLAMCAAYGASDPEPRMLYISQQPTDEWKAWHEKAKVRSAALDVLPLVARTGTHLFQFMDFVTQLRGKGRALHEALQDWYLDKSAADLALQAIKYRQRYGWTHRDVLRIARPRPPLGDKGKVLAFMAGKLEDGARFDDVEGARRLLQGFVKAQQAETTAESARLVIDYSLPREALKPEHLSDPHVWNALLHSGMPYTALIRNLGNMSKCGLLAPMSQAESTIAHRLGDPEGLRRARVHPLAILTALRQYASGHGLRGAGTWTPSQRVVDALDAAFYASFDYVAPAGKRTMICADVSPSMWSGQAIGSPLAPAEAAGILAALVMHLEPQSAVYGFAGGGSRYGHSRLAPEMSGIEPLPISPRMRMDDIMRVTESHRGRWSSTDASLPMRFAQANGLEVETFIVITDNESMSGPEHPHVSLERYRQATGIPARLVAMAMTATNVSIADPTDPGQLDVVGFDSAAPEIIRQFSAGLI